MAPSDSPTDRNNRPAGAAGDGMDAYPTYHDRANSAGAGSGAKPTDAALPRNKRTYASPMFLGLMAFVLILVIAVIFGGMELTRTTDEALAPGDAATPTSSATTGAPDNMGTQIPDTEGGLDRDAQAEPSTGPGQVEAAPGAADVPGGAGTTPVLPAPAQ